MKKHLKNFSDTVNKKQISIGILALLLGLLVYLIDRPPDTIYFIYKFDISLYKILPNLFGPTGNSLPNFIHPLSFILITAGIVACKRRSYFIICLGWFLANCVFEFGQRLNSSHLKMLPDWLDGIPFWENFKSFFVHGAFDSFDLAAITIGTICAYCLLLFTMERRNER